MIATSFEETSPMPMQFSPHATRSKKPRDPRIVAAGLALLAEDDATLYIDERLRQAEGAADPQDAAYWRAVLSEFRVIVFAENDAQFLSA
jgi:hypothetical protein